MLHVNHHTPPLALIGVAVIASATTIGLSACGDSHKSISSDKTALGANAQPESAATAAKVAAVDKVAERIVIARVGHIPITKASFSRGKAVSTPKTASYEPRSRKACSAVRAKLEVTSPKKVDGHAPTTAQLQRQCKQESDERIKRQVLGRLISSQWIIQEAEQLGLQVTDEEANRQYEKDKHLQFASEAQFQRYLQSIGATEADLRFDIKRQLAEERLRSRIKGGVGKLSQDQITAYYNAHKDKYVIPEKRDIEAIRTWTRPAIENAEREVRAGVKFGDIARRVSIDHPSAENGGVTLGVERGQQEEGLDEAIFAAKPHVLVGPLHLRKRYYIFEVTKIYPSSQKPFAQIEASITQELEDARQKRALARFIAAWRRHWTAKTDCSHDYVVPKCKQYNTTSAGVVEEDPYTFN